jgi:response regulator RpfG family c-di-GMP phosphodiesterase
MPTDPATVLVVDDDPRIAHLIQDHLREEGFPCVTATTSREARELLDRRHFDVMVTDVRMPDISGLELFEHARKTLPSCKVILMSGASTLQEIAQAILLGAYDFIEKPFDMSEMVRAVSRAASDRSSLPYLPTKAASAMRLESRAKQAALDVIRALITAVEAKDPFTRRHSEQVAHYATHLAGRLGLAREKVETIHVTSMMHDVGKIGVPDGILTKPGRLTREEFEVIRRHPSLGESIVSQIACFSVEAKLIRHHHENWDGRGYPDGLTGEETPLGARIVRVADAMDAMLMHRSYKEPYPVEKMIDEIIRCAGTEFDPRLSALAVEWCRANPDKLVLPGQFHHLAERPALV